MSPEIAAKLASVRHWHQNYEIVPGIWTNGTYQPQSWWDWLALPDDLSGIRALDIGACDGFFSLMLQRAGAEVTAVDYKPKTMSGFQVMEELNGVSIPHLNCNLFDLPTHDLGKFDVVLFLGVLYHLPDPYRGLSIIADLCDGKLYIETAATSLPETDLPIMRFYPNGALNNDPTNFWAPNRSCLEEMVRDTGFVVDRVSSSPDQPVESYRLALAASRVHDPRLASRRKLAYGLKPAAPPVD